MSARCPQGHVSDSLDYCDVCGTPMGTAADAGGSSGDPVPPAHGSAEPGPQLPEPGPAPGAATQTCPHCGALNVADALFCESCGYDFTTGTPPMGADPAPSPSLDSIVGTDEEREDEERDEDPEPAGDEDSERDEDTEPDEENPASVPVSSADPAPGRPKPVHSQQPSETDSGEGEPVTGTEPAAEHEPQATADPPPAQPAEPAHRKARHTPPSRALAEAWVVELWVDPDWYAVQQTEEACPSAGVPDIVLLTRSTALIGRPSGSLGVRPEIDAGADSAVSRRHAQLTSDGQRWWVEDLGSSNGTFVGTVGEPLPTVPLPPGQRVEIDRDDRLYVGAWTRIVLRQATGSEEQGTG